MRQRIGLAHRRSQILLDIGDGARVELVASLQLPEQHIFGGQQLSQAQQRALRGYAAPQPSAEQAAQRANSCLCFYSGLLLGNVDHLVRLREATC